jgi:hypothetical protein
MIQFHKYSSPEGDAARQAAIAARQFFWGQLAWADLQLPEKLPPNIFYAQEIVACLGMERACSFYNLSDEQYFFYLGFVDNDDPLPPYVPAGVMVYQPRNSGFFSVIENLIVASFVARLSNKQLVVDNTYQWWDYEQPFDDIFRNSFTLIDRLPNDVQAVHFDAMRDFIFGASEDYLLQFYKFKLMMYGKIERDIRRYYKGELFNVERAGLVFIRGGDKAYAEAPVQPYAHYMHDIDALARRCSRTVVLSDTYTVAAYARAGTAAINITPIDHMGYHHKYGEKVSCLPILKNYLALVDCLESVSCPSANLVNAAHWTRSNDTFNYNTYNPVYRYALI